MTKVNIGGFELDSTKLPKEGLDYSKFDEQTKNALSVFDTDKKKGHLSKAELQNAIIFFASQDGATEVKEDSEGRSIKLHKKDGKIDNFEYEETLLKYDDKVENSQKMRQIKNAEKAAARKQIAEFIEFYKRNNDGKLPSDKILNDVKEKISNKAKYNNLKEKHDAFGLNDYMDNAIIAIYMGIKANEKGLKQTDTAQNVFQDNKGNYFTFMNRQFYPANKQATYKIYGQPNKKGQKSLAAYDRNGKVKYIKALNYQNKAYTKEETALNIIRSTRFNENTDTETLINGTNYTNDFYTEEDSTGKMHYKMNGYEYKWNAEKHAFYPANKLPAISQTYRYEIN